MARSPSPTLTPAELRVMRVLWRIGPAPAADLVAAVRGRRGTKDSTIRTILRILERKGYVRHRVEGRAFVYQAVVAEGDAQRGAVRDLVARFFDNRPERLVLNLLEHRDVNAAELARLRKLVEDDRP
ncbi:MAG TPA: BlaI/MecI/CopY family transcriptional regulator [Gemmatimonadales bacterium]